MSEWIVDRRPTKEDCKGVLGTRYESQVWVNVLDTVVTHYFYHVEAGVAWHPIVIEKPEPYVAPKSEPKYVVMKDIYYTDSWAVYDGSKYVTGRLPTREAAERIAAIFNEVMP